MAKISVFGFKSSLSKDFSLSDFQKVHNHDFSLEKTTLIKTLFHEDPSFLENVFSDLPLLSFNKGIDIRAVNQVRFQEFLSFFSDYLEEKNKASVKSISYWHNHNIEDFKFLYDLIYLFVFLIDSEYDIAFFTLSDK